MESRVVVLRYDPSMRAAELRRLHMQDRWLDPHYRRAMLRQRVCAGCGLRSTAGGLGNHQKSSGHSGWTTT